MSAILNFLKDITRNENKLRKCPDIAKYVVWNY